MSKLQELIQALCPDGVPHLPIKEIASCYAGATPKTTVKEYWDSGNIPWMSSGEVNKQIITETENFITQAGFDSCSTKMVPANSVVIALAGQGKTRGLVALTKIDLCTNQSLCAIVPNAQMNSSFLYHFLGSQYQKLRTVSSGDGTRGGLNLQMINSYVVPVPPIEVQDEIVRILDRFADYAAELQAELQARKEQYEYYRNLLLTFNPSACGCGTDGEQEIKVTNTPPGSYQITWKTMGEIGKFFGGLTGKSKADFSNGNARFISYMNVYSNIALNQSANEFVRILPNEKQNVLRYGDALFTGSSETPDECGMSSVVTAEPKEPLYLNSFSFGFRLDDNSIYHPDFFKHLLRSSAIRAQIAKTANGVTRFNVSKALFAKVILPIPPIELQVKIANILDRFETLVNDLTQGLPAEIAAVKEQYEYYRNKLLTFKKAS